MRKMKDGRIRKILQLVFFALIFASAFYSSPAQSQTLSVTKEACSWSNAPNAPDPLACQTLTNVVGPGQPIYYRVTIYAPSVSPGLQWIVELEETYPTGFADNVQQVRCVNAIGTQLFNASDPLLASIGPFTVPDSSVVHCTMAGFFTPVPGALDAATNSVAVTATNSIDSNQVYIGEHQTNPGITFTYQPDADLVVTKSVDTNSLTLDGSVLYTIRVQNNGPDPLFLGPFFRLDDNMVASGFMINGRPTVRAQLDISSIQCTPVGGAECVGTTPIYSSALDFSGLLARWKFPAGSDGAMPAGSYFDLSFEVDFTQLDTCVLDQQLSQTKTNKAHVRLDMQPGNTFSDLDPANNTSAPVSTLLTTDLQFDPACWTTGGGGGPTPNVSVEKKLIAPSSGSSSTSPIPWGSEIEFEISVTNNNAASITDVKLRDVITGSTPAGLTVISSSCSGCSAGPVNQVDLISGAEIWYTEVPLIVAGATATFRIKFRIDQKGCKARTGNQYLTHYKNYANVGFTWEGRTYEPGFARDQVSFYVPPLPDCDFTVSKAYLGTPPQVIPFNSLLSYSVSVRNNHAFPVIATRFIDRLTTTPGGYALNFQYRKRYICNLAGNVFSSNNFPIFQDETSFSNNSGKAFADLIDHNTVLLFGPGAQMNCTIHLIIKEPPATDNFCRGDGLAILENKAQVLINNSISNALPSTFASVSTPLPRCYDLGVEKDVQPGGSVYPTGQPLTYTITVRNSGDDIVNMSAPNWFVLSDLFANNYTVSLATGNPQCGPLPTDACEIITTGNPLEVGIKNLPKNSTLELTFTIAPPFTGPFVRNDVRIEPRGNLPARWFTETPISLTNFKEVPIIPRPNSAMICVFKFEDHNASGSRDAGESGVGGFDFTVYNANGATVATLTTDASGNACTPASLTMGDYSIEEAPKVGWTNTLPGSDPAAIDVTLARGQQRYVFFGNIREIGALKVCKVGEPPMTPGEVFTFKTSDGRDVAIPWGPLPGGTCAVMGEDYPVGDTVSIYEMPVAGTTLVDIDVVPPNRAVSTDAPSREAVVEIGAGVTEVVFHNRRKQAYLEICKISDLPGDYGFIIGPPTGPKVTVPAGSCSPAIAVPTGTVTIQEDSSTFPGSNTVMSTCLAEPSHRLVTCDPASRTMTVETVAGDVSDQTIATFVNEQDALLLQPEGGAEKP